MNKEDLHYLALRVVTWPFSIMPYVWIHAVGKCFGIIAFYCMRGYRKRTLSNLALATDLSLTKKELFKIAKQTFQNLAINCLEYSRLAKETNFARVLHCENPDVAMNLYNQGKGVIFFCGHQSNWEVLFLDGTSRMRGIAIGKSIKNKRLYRWIVSIREKNGGKIILPQNAMREGFRALKKGSCVGIVGDQGMPGSGYSFPFFGRRAWTSTAPALLAYKTGSPIIFAATHRVPGGYRIVYSDPIWPNLDIPLDLSVTSMMDQLLHLLQKSIQERPGEWLWQHNRWKQQTLKTLHKRFRWDCICIILPQDQPSLQKILPHLQSLKNIYFVDFLSLIAPNSCRNQTLIEVDEIIYYKEMKEVLLQDYRFKLVFNFSNHPQVHRHYERLSAFEVLDMAALQKLAAWPDPDNYSEIFKRALCQKEAWDVS